MCSSRCCPFLGHRRYANITDDDDDDDDGGDAGACVQVGSAEEPCGSLRSNALGVWRFSTRVEAQGNGQLGDGDSTVD